MPFSNHQTNTMEEQAESPGGTGSAENAGSAGNASPAENASPMENASPAENTAPDCPSAGNFFRAIAETVEGVRQMCDKPSLDLLRDKEGKLDFSAMEPRDREFMARLVKVAELDPDVLKRVAIMRHKLNNGIKLTRTEASELLEQLKCKGFYLTDLDISGYEFGELDLTDAFFGGGYYARYATVRGDNRQIRMHVGRDNDETGMYVGGDNIQHGKIVGGRNFQGGILQDAPV